MATLPSIFTPPPIGGFVGQMPGLPAVSAPLPVMQVPAPVPQPAAQPIPVQQAAPVQVQQQAQAPITAANATAAATPSSGPVRYEAILGDGIARVTLKMATSRNSIDKAHPHFGFDIRYDISRSPALGQPVEVKFLLKTPAMWTKRGIDLKIDQKGRKEYSMMTILERSNSEHMRFRQVCDLILMRFGQYLNTNQYKSSPAGLNLMQVRFDTLDECMRNIRPLYIATDKATGMKKDDLGLDCEMKIPLKYWPTNAQGWAEKFCPFEFSCLETHYDPQRPVAFLKGIVPTRIPQKPGEPAVLRFNIPWEKLEGLAPKVISTISLTYLWWAGQGQIKPQMEAVNNVIVDVKPVDSKLYDEDSLCEAAALGGELMGKLDETSSLAVAKASANAGGAGGAGNNAGSGFAHPPGGSIPPIPASPQASQASQASQQGPPSSTGDLDAKLAQMHVGASFAIPQVSQPPQAHAAAVGGINPALSNIMSAPLPALQ